MPLPPAIKGDKWYSANAEALQELLGFLYAECCTRNQAIKPQNIISPSK